MKAVGSRISQRPDPTISEPLLLIEPKALIGIVASTSDITLLVAADGTIRSVLTNASTSDFGKLDHWIGRNIRSFLTSESVPKLDKALDRLARGDAPPRSVELNHRDNAVWDFPIQYSFHPLEGESGVLMIGRDLRPVAETQRQLVQAQIALERGYEAQRDFDSRYRMLLATVSDAIVLVSLGDGRIADLNEHAADLLGQPRRDLLGSVFAGQMNGTSRAELEARLLVAAVADGEGPLRVEPRAGRAPILVHPTVFRSGNDRLAMCRLVRVGASAAAADGGLSAPLRALFDAGVDALVFTRPDGVISHASDRFLAMVDAPDLTAVRDRSLAEFLLRGPVDLNVVLDNVRRTGRMRLYASEIVGDFGARTQVELSATSLGEAGEGLIGFVLRDAVRAEAIRRPAAEGEGAAQQNILELVGQASLKEIVAETSDVIERLCIETAIRLTNNNRVAAAEMLGLSRQSLYVKLRKYDILKKGEDENGRA